MNEKRKLLDVVLLLDDTESMTPFFNRIRFFCSEMNKALLTYSEKVRIQLILFRDYADHPMAIRKSRHFILPDQMYFFDLYINQLVANIEGDEPENGLEAIATAIHNEWSFDIIPSQGLIILLSDGPAHPLTPGLSRADFPGYPLHMPTSIEALGLMWDEMQNKRQNIHVKHHPVELVMFAPNDADTYGRLLALQHTSIHPVDVGEGLASLEIKEMLEKIVSQLVA